MGAVELKSILATDQLQKRSSGGQNTEQVNEALRTVAAEIPGGRARMMTALVNAAFDICNAHSAGASSLRYRDGEEHTLFIEPIVGRLAPRSGIELTIDCPCGYTLRKDGEAQLFANPALHFDQLNRLELPIIESLCVSIVSENMRVGTLWVMSHDEELKFTGDHSQALITLATFAGAALPMARQYDGNT
jgi:GAF domain-containing protein